jgi:sugar-specific transcriptional regulator TrmB
MIDGMGMESITDRLLIDFQKLGLSHQETMAYISLLKKDNVTGYELSKNARIHTSKIYGILSKLLEKNLVIAVDTHPVKYFPRPPQEVLAKVKQDFDDAVENLKVPLEQVYAHSEKSDLVAWNITGRADIIRKAKDLINETEEKLYLAAWEEEFRSIRRATTRADQRGVKVTCLAYGMTNFNVGKIYRHRPSDYPFRERGERRFVLVSDEKKALISGFKDRMLSGALWTENSGLVQLIRDFIIHEIYIIKIEEKFPEQIHSAFGKNWEKIRPI